MSAVGAVDRSRPSFDRLGRWRTTAPPFYRHPAVSFRPLPGSGRIWSATRSVRGSGLSGNAVLIVDDNELNLRLAETVLRQAGFDISVARTAAEARERLPERQWAAVLMDLRLPDGNGLDVVRELRADPRMASIRVAALTASALVADPEAAFQAGCDAYISKPIEVRTFAEEVRSLIDRPPPTVAVPTTPQ